MPEEYYDLLIEEKLLSYLLSMKICPNLRGFSFLLEGAKILIKDITKKRNINKILYAEIADKYAINKTIIDGAMRHAIDVGYKKGGFGLFENLTNIPFNNKPTPRELLSAFAISINNEKRNWIKK